MCCHSELVGVALSAIERYKFYWHISFDYAQYYTCVFRMTVYFFVFLLQMKYITIEVSCHPELY